MASSKIKKIAATSVLTTGIAIGAVLGSATAHAENGTEGGNKAFAPSVIEFPSQARYWAKWACPTLNPARDAMSGGAISKKMC